MVFIEFNSIKFDFLSPQRSGCFSTRASSAEVGVSFPLQKGAGHRESFGDDEFKTRLDSGKKKKAKVICWARLVQRGTFQICSPKSDFSGPLPSARPSVPFVRPTEDALARARERVARRGFCSSVPPGVTLPATCVFRVWQAFSSLAQTWLQPREVRPAHPLGDLGKGLIIS